MCPFRRGPAWPGKHCQTLRSRRSHGSSGTGILPGFLELYPVMSDAFDEFFAAVREAAGPRVWSKGVEIARVDSVRAESSDEQLAVLAVKDDTSAVARRVHLLLADGEWECDCNGDDDPCRHVAAAVIAYRRARERGEALPQADQVLGRIRYRLRREAGQLALDRVVVLGEREDILPASVASITSGRVRGPRLLADQTDLAIDMALGAHRQGPIPAAAVGRLFAAMMGVESLVFEGQAVRVRADPIGLAIRLRDDGPGVRLTGEQDPDIAFLFANGAVLTKNGTLQPARVPQLTPADQKLVREGRFFSPRELSELAAEILPRLAKQLRVIRESKNLPDTVRMRLRPALDLHARAGDLVVTPVLVYGSPPVAIVRHGDLEPLGDETPLRDLDEERRLRDTIWQELRMELDRPQTFQGMAAIQFVAETLPNLRSRARTSRFDVAVIGDGAAVFAVHEPLQALLQVSDHDLQLDFVSEGWDRPGGEPSAGIGSGEETGRHHVPKSQKRASAAAVLSAYARGESLVPLLGGGYAPMPVDWLVRYGDRVRDLLDAKAETGAVPRPLLPTLAAVADEAGVDVPAGLLALRGQFENFSAMPVFASPEGLDRVLRDYQKEGVRWLNALRTMGCGALLADDMGLGKTLQAICVLSRRTLIVAPTSVVPNWLREIHRFRPQLVTQLYHGANRSLDPRADVVVTTYAILRLDQDLLAAEHWSCVVLDEAQAIKNPDSQAARAAFRLTADFRLSLSGTPVENRLDDLWSQMRFANPGLLGRRSDFDERYGRRISQGDAVAAAGLRRRIKPFLLRRLKSEVARELPPRTDTILYVELSSDERSIYEAVLAAARRDVVAKLDEGATALDALEALLRLRQACCHARLLPGAPGPAVSSKLEMLVERLAVVADEGHRALVFSQWTSLLDLLEPLLDHAGIRYARLDGSTRDREAVVAGFQAEDGPSCLIMSLKAGGVGLNLTAADHVFIVDPWWNPAAEDQAADRAHRIGQTRPVQVHRIVAQATVEERILALQEHKRVLAQAATAGAGQVGLTRHDLLSLFD